MKTHRENPDSPEMQAAHQQNEREVFALQQQAKSEQAEMPTDDEIVWTMAKFGGSFVKQLAQAWRYADEENQRRIKATWPEYWQKYAEMAVAFRKPCQPMWLDGEKI